MSTQLSSDLAFRVLRLEQQLESYQHLHAEELDNIRRALHDVKEQMLALVTKETQTNLSDDSKNS